MGASLSSCSRNEIVETTRASVMLVNSHILKDRGGFVRWTRHPCFQAPDPPSLRVRGIYDPRSSELRVLLRVLMVLKAVGAR